MMSRCHLYLRLLLALFAVSVVTAASTASSSAITSTNTTAVPTASTNVSTSVPSSTTMNTNTTAAPTTTALSGSSNITSTMQVTTTASTPTQLLTTTAAGGMNTTVSSNNSMTTANATTTLPNITGSVSVTANGNMTTPSPSQGTATTAPLNTTAGPQGNVTTSPNNTAGPQGNTTMHTSPVTPTMTSTTGAPSSAVSTNASIGVANSTTALPTESPPTTTTTQTTTTNTAPNVSTRPLNPDVFFVLNLTMGPNSNITCVGNCTPEGIRNLTTLAFLGRAGFYDVRIVPMTNRRKRDVMSGHVMLEVRFIASRLLELNEPNVSEMVKSALQQLNDSGSVIIRSEVMVTIANAFALTSRNVCQAVGVCDLGYVCLKRGVEAACYHLCDEDSTWSCGEHGTCQVHVMGGQAHKSCKCASDYDNVWSGDKCQDSEISGEKKARIAGGVLGAFCGVFIIIIIVLLVLRGGCCGGTSSQKTYQMGMSNAGYTDISMQKL